MPTKLGNVLSAADLRVGKRYQLDAGLIWSRLQPNLPKEFADSLQDSRMAPLETLGTAPLILTVLVPSLFPAVAQQGAQLSLLSLYKKRADEGRLRRAETIRTQAATATVVLTERL